MMNEAEIAALTEGLDWDKVGGLMPVVVQDSETLQVLMLAYMSREALAQTVSTGKVTFFSRTKNRLWTKGETSSHFLEFLRVTKDCDGDSLLVMAKPAGPTCHRETTSCFGEESAPGIGFLGHLMTVIDQRFRDRPEGSYTTRLLARGSDRIIQKVGEEAVEVVIAAKNTDSDALVSETSDLLFHLLVLFREKQISFSRVIEKLRERNQNKK